MKTNLNKIISSLRKERYIGGIIYGYADIGKTNYIMKFLKANKNLKVFYVDVLNEISKLGNTQLVFELTPKKFIEWCINLVPISELDNFEAVVIDNFDFLVNLWSENKQNEFANRIMKLEKIVFPISFIVIMQEISFFNDIIKTSEQKNYQQIYRFDNFEAI